MMQTPKPTPKRAALASRYQTPLSQTKTPYVITLDPEESEEDGVDYEIVDCEEVRIEDDNVVLYKIQWPAGLTSWVDANLIDPTTLATFHARRERALRARVRLLEVAHPANGSDGASGSGLGRGKNVRFDGPNGPSREDTFDPMDQREE
ncbi:hypothetical protein HK104_002232 [Borealophlyctis nickersoniae]|nr:hypothetical protein HK104_002232 [Borealophlyctis nickersoniae]